YTQEMEEYIEKEYPSFTKEDKSKILLQYLHQHIKAHLTAFDPLYLSYIQLRLVRMMSNRRPYVLTAADILKAGLQLNFEADNFYSQLNQCLYQCLQAAVSEDILAEFVNKLRQWVESHPGQPLEQFQSEFIASPEPSTPALTLKPRKPLSKNDPEYWDTIIRTNYYFNNYQTPEEAMKMTDSKPSQRKRVRKYLTVACLSMFLLIGGAWLRSTGLAGRITGTYGTDAINVTNSAAMSKTTRSDGSVAVKLQVEKGRKPDLTAYASNTGFVRSKYVNRSGGVHKVAVARGINTRKVNEAGLPELGTVIVGYKEVVKANQVQKVPVRQAFVNKLRMKAFAKLVPKPGPPAGEAYTVAETLESSERLSQIESNATALSNESPNQAGAVVGVIPSSARTVTVDPRVIPAGSKLYIKFPEEYQDLNGVYTAAVSRTENQSQGVDIHFGEELDEKLRTKLEKFDSSDVEVYILK
ncbi:MAG TPA: hypothetical protein VIM29_14140, partial [Bacillota bacterium]